jgi:hypothetical protein
MRKLIFALLFAISFCVPAMAQTSPPVITPVSGTYSTSQSMSMTNPSATPLVCWGPHPGIVIGGASTCPTYSQNFTSGTAPSCGSGTCSYYAVAGGTGFTDSAQATVTYTITASGTVINYPSGFGASCDPTNIWLENSATCAPPSVYLMKYTPTHLSDNLTYKTPENIQSFTTQFTFRVSCANVTSGNPCGNGFGFGGIINPNYKTNGGGPYTYEADSNQFAWANCSLVNFPICPAPPPSVTSNFPTYGFLVNFDMTDYSQNATSNKSWTGFYQGPGNFPTNASGYYYNPRAVYDMSPSGINLTSGDEMQANVIYNGTTISVTLQDTVTGAIYTNSYPANLPAACLGNSCMIGFGAGTNVAVEDVYIDTWTYTLGQTQAFPVTFSVPPGTYTSSQTLALAGQQSGTSIYYTTDGSTPTFPVTGTTQTYSGPITVSSTETVKAIGVVSGYSNSPLTAESYTINGGATQVAAPTFTPASGSYSGPQNITPSDSTSGATMYYTTDGTTPTVYSHPFTLPFYSSLLYGDSPTTTVKAIAAKSGMLPSNVTTLNLTLGAVGASPTFSPTAGTYASAQTVAISTTAGAIICYSTGGTPQTNGSTGCNYGTLYTGPITVSSDEMVFAVAGGTGFSDSLMASAPYTIGGTLTAATPSFSPAGGTYTSTQNVAINGSTNPYKATLVQYSARSGFNTGGGFLTPDLNLSYAVTQGNTVIAAIFMETAPGTALSLTNGSGPPITMNLVASQLSGGSGLYIYAATNVPSGQVSLRFTTSQTSNGASAIMEFQGLATASLINTSAFGFGTGTTLTTPSVTPSAGSYLLSILAQDSIASIPTSGSGLSLTNVGPGNVLGNPGLTQAGYIQVAQGWGNSGTPYTATWNNLTSGHTSIAALLAVNSLGSSFNANAVMGQYTGGTNGSSPFSVLANPTQNVVQSQVAISSATTSASFTTTNAVASGNTGVIYVWEGNSSATPTIPPDSLGNVWTLAGSTTSISGLYAYISAFTHSGSDTITVSVGSGNTFGATFGEYSGVTTLDSTASSSTTSTVVPVAGATITTTATDLIIDGIGNYGYDSITGTSGFNPNISTTTSTPTNPTSNLTISDSVAPIGTYTTPAYYEIDVTNPPIYAAGIEHLMIALKATGVTPNYNGVNPPAVGSSSIFYTNNGSTPTTSSTVYSGPLAVSTTQTIKAIATALGYTQSAVGTALYTIASVQLAAPTFAPGSGTYSGTQSVTITPPAGATACYTVNATPPLPVTPGTCPAGTTTVSGPVSVVASEIINAYSTQTGFSTSVIASASYVIGLPTAVAPVFSPTAGSYPGPITVTITSTTSGATIYYTTDGSTPTSSSLPYSTGIILSGSTNFKAITIASGYTNSSVTSADYTLPATAGITVSIQGSTVTIKSNASIK